VKKIETGVSQAEADVLDLLCIGMLTKVAAHKLGISARTAETHVNNAKKRIGAKNMAQLCVMYDRMKRQPEVSPEVIALCEAHEVQEQPQ